MAFSQKTTVITEQYFLEKKSFSSKTKIVTDECYWYMRWRPWYIAFFGMDVLRVYQRVSNAYV